MTGVVIGDADRGSRHVIEVAHLRKAYGDVVAVDDVSLTVDKGEIVGILGPNGAGKTTIAECVVGLRRPDAGRIRVLGLDPLADGAVLHEVVGVQLQSGELSARLRVGEIVELYRSFTVTRRAPVSCWRSSAWPGNAAHSTSRCRAGRNGGCRSPWP